MDTPTPGGIRNNPLFDTLIKRRRRFVAWLTAMTVAPYCAFILVAAFAPRVLAIKLSEGSAVNIGWPIGAALIVGCWCLTGLYVRRANGEFDALTARILAGEHP